jgi:hypothetical protein
VYHVLNRSVSKMQRIPLSAGLLDRAQQRRVGQPVVENARHGGDQSIAIALAGGTAGELGGSRQRSSDDDGMRPSAGEHRARTTIRRRASPCLGWRVVSPCGVRIDFWISHYITPSSPLGGSGGHSSDSFNAFRTLLASGEPPLTPRRAS